MKNLNFNEVSRVAGGGLVGDALGCLGGIGVTLASDGLAAAFGGVATVGACMNMTEDFNNAAANIDPFLGYDDGLMCYPVQQAPGPWDSSGWNSFNVY